MRSTVATRYNPGARDEPASAKAFVNAGQTADTHAAWTFRPTNNGEAQAPESMDVIDLEKRTATVLPDGWRLVQIDAQQPATGYAEFKREILTESSFLLRWN